MRTFKRVDAADLKFFEELMPGRVFSGEAISTDYDHDEMTEYGHFMPEAVLQALSAEEISRVLAYCNEKEIAVTPRGAGTGLCGGCVAIHGGIVLSTEKMKKVIDIDTKNMTATIEPGILLMEFPKTLEGTGLFYPPDPGEKTATMGGNVMTNAGGMRAVRYGVTRDYVLGMQVVLADGRIVNMGGKNVKTSSGYSLVDLMIGSEGTLGFLTQLTVKAAKSQNKEILVAGSLSPLTLHAQPFGETPFLDIVNIYAEQAFALKRGGADILLADNMISLSDRKSVV